MFVLSPYRGPEEKMVKKWFRGSKITWLKNCEKLIWGVPQRSSKGMLKSILGVLDFQDALIKKDFSPKRQLALAILSAFPM